MTYAPFPTGYQVKSVRLRGAERDNQGNEHDYARMRVNNFHRKSQARTRQNGSAKRTGDSSTDRFAGDDEAGHLVTIGNESEFRVMGSPEQRARLHRLAMHA